MIALSTRLESRLEYLYLSTEPHYLRYLEEDEKNFLTQEFGFSRKELRYWWVTRQWKDRRKKIARKQAQAMVDSSTEDSQDSHFEENSISPNSSAEARQVEETISLFKLENNQSTATSILDQSKVLTPIQIATAQNLFNPPKPLLKLDFDSSTSPFPSFRALTTPFFDDSEMSCRSIDIQNSPTPSKTLSEFTFEICSGFPSPPCSPYHSFKFDFDSD